MPTTAGFGPAVTLNLAADIIEPHISGTFRVRERAVGSAEDLARTGLLAGHEPQRGTGTVRDQVVNVLQCRHEWRTAARIANELAEAGLLRQEI